MTGPSTPEASHHCWTEKKDHLPWSVGSAPLHTAQNVLCLLCHKDTLLSHIQNVCPPGPPDLFLQSCFLPSWSPVLTGAWGYSSSKAGLFTPLYEIFLYSVLQPVQLSLNGSILVWYINHSSQFRTICKFAEGTLCPIIQVINKEVEWYWPICGLPLNWFSAANHNPLGPLVQPVFNTPCCPLI